MSEPKTTLTDKEIMSKMWEAKMMGKWVPTEGETLREAYAKVYGDTDAKV